MHDYWYHTSSVTQACNFAGEIWPHDFTVATVRTTKGRLFDMVVRTHINDPMSRNIRHKGYWEIQEPQELAELGNTKLPSILSKPRYLIDVGANIGFYSLLFAHAGWHSIAIEPMPRNLLALNMSLCLNPTLAQRVTIVPVAISTPENEGRSCTVTANNKQFGNGGIGNGILNCERNPKLRCISGQDEVCATVHTLTLDSALRASKLHSADVVKIDIEGHECAAIVSNGSKTLFSHWHPMLVQWEGKSQNVDRCMRKLMHKHNYRIGNRYGNDRNTVAVIRI